MPQEARREERRTRLLASGFELFGTRGYHAATVREICTHARLTERYFYESFANLQALFKAVHKQLHVDLQQRTFGAIARAPRTPDGMAEASLRVFFEFVREDPRRGQILLVEAANAGEEMREQAHGTIADYVNLSRNVIVMLFPTIQSELALDPGYVAQGLVGSLIFQFYRWAEEDFKTPLESLVNSTMVFHRALAVYLTKARLELAQAKQAPEKPTDAG